MSEEFQKAEVLNPKPVTVQQALQIGAGFLAQAGVESARLDAELLLGKVLGARREGLYLNYEMLLGTSQQALYQSLLQRRAQREPISYIIGEREFWSLDFLVTPDVLVPRPETEMLVEVALRLIETQSQMANLKWQILDLGTGSCAIAVSLAKELSDVEIWATDLSAAALEIAQANVVRYDVREKIQLLKGDLFEAVEDRQGFFHMIVSNPPYVRRSDRRDLPPEVRDWEPKLALDGGPDGLDLYRRIIRDGHLYLADGGCLALEIGADMGEEVSRLFASVGCYSTPSLYQDYAGRDRVIVVKKLSQPSKTD